ncbi:efflux RND transporter periplasmic adaptor subunit [Geobacter sp. AOG1]|uniref:efflux RND transporter periplasmic adaptor subunit n=1 Tax=Geobacter sp. AOG1 TaxID=1566346 RepID=UPI001CC57AC3|nr:efflux RND transporter periplasmic adaptor subunit [Geobacter sp. AOG1]GFE57321.1 RND transporter [Geobacter sp. AOG1]
MKKTGALLLVTAALVCASIAGGCTKKSGEKGEGGTAAKQPVAVEVAVAGATDLSEGMEVTGSLEPKFSADVKTQIPGLVKQVYVTEWVRVRKGQPLASIDVGETEAQVKRTEAGVESAKAGLAQAQVQLTRSERELARMLKLKESGLATQQAVDDARTEVAATTARVEAARAQIRAAEEEVRQARVRLRKGLVTSPMDGVVALRDVNVGDLAGDAAAVKPVFRIVDNRILNLTVTVSSADSARVKIGQPLEFTVDAIPGRTFTGRVMFVNPELSATDRSLKVIAEVRNDGELLKGGLFVKGRILLGMRKGVIQVPRNALAAWDTTARKANVFVVENGTARLRPVTTGTVNGEQVEVTAGLKGGERYVTRGGFTLRDGDRVTMAVGPSNGGTVR